MGSVFTLDSLREEAEKKYAPVTLDLGDGVEIELRSLIRLPKKDRAVAFDLLKTIEDNDGNSSDGVEVLTESALKLLGTVADKGPLLVKALGDDLSLILEVLSLWMDGSQPGEAESSQT
jgi:hypothetical protein